MGKIDIYAVIIAGFSAKVAKIYFYDGLIFYFTSNRSVRVDFSFDSRVRNEQDSYSVSPSAFRT